MYCTYKDGTTLELLGDTMCPLYNNDGVGLQESYYIPDENITVKTSGFWLTVAAFVLLFVPTMFSKKIRSERI
jgi:hypothetical protein